MDPVDFIDISSSQTVISMRTPVNGKKRHSSDSGDVNASKKSKGAEMASSVDQDKTMMNT